MSSEKSNGVSSPYDSLKNVLHHLTTLASRPELQNATTIFDEIDHHKRQIKAEKEELAKGQNQNQAAIEAIMKLNEKSKIEQKSIETENISLQSNLKKKEKGLEECSQQIKSLRAQLAKLQSDHSKEVANVAQCCRDITGLHETLKKKDTEYDKVLNDRSNLKATLSTEQKKIDNLKNDLISLREEERKSSSKLKKLEGFTVGYSRVDEELMLDEFPKLWDYAIGELSAITNQDLGDKALNDKQFWDRFRRETYNAVVHHVPLFASNSPSAKGMRLVVMLAILAREIDQHIFQPNYLSEESNLRTIFCKLAATDDEKEAFCRSLLLSIDSTTQQESLELRIQAIVRKVSLFLFHALSEAQYGELRQCLDNVVRRAVQVWRPIQASQKRFEPDFEPLEWDDDEWCLFRFPGEDQEQHENDEDNPDDILLTVFPRISLVEGNKRLPQTFVTHLMKSQKLCVAAEQETPREATSPRIGRMSNGARRKSIAQSTPRPNGGSFLGPS